MVKPTQNRENIIRIDGELKLINQKLDNHISHISSKIDWIYRLLIINVIGVLGWALRSFLTGM